MITASRAKSTESRGQGWERENVVAGDERELELVTSVIMDDSCPAHCPTTPHQIHWPCSERGEEANPSGRSEPSAPTPELLFRS
jgi:hypothetical protein